ncbi:DUF933 domain-containing protein [bacterium]|nr:DUF933 domain-containing protein [bacterium]
MKSGLIGFPGSGVTSMFCLFSGRRYEDIAFSGKKEINLGETKVPDERVDKLTEIFNPKKKVYATMEFADVPVELDNSGAFASSTVNHIRNMDAIVVVIRSFENPTVPYPKIDPLHDLESTLEEAILTDLIQIEGKLDRLGRECKLKSREAQIFQLVKDKLEESIPIRDMNLDESTLKEISGYRFLTEKPWLVIVNVDPGEDMPDTVVNFLQSNNLNGLALSGQFELELIDLDPDEQTEFLTDMGLERGGCDRFIQMAYKSLDLISFLTYGTDECRAWSITRGSDAVQAAGKIHSDLARGFIRAEIAGFDDFLACGGSMQAVKKAGKMRMEGKKYIVKDGDLITVLFNV